MKKITLWALAALALLAGCDSVSVDKPFGTPPAKIVAEEWTGYWHIDDDEVFQIKVVDAAAGLLEAAVIKDSPEGQRIQRTAIHLRQVGDWKFLFLPGEKEGEGFTWVKYENYEGKMVMAWLPSPNDFKAAVEQGLLRGEVRTELAPAVKGRRFGETKSTSVLLKAAEREEIELIMSEERGLQFDGTPAAVLADQLCAGADEPAAAPPGGRRRCALTRPCRRTRRPASCRRGDLGRDLVVPLRDEVQVRAEAALHQHRHRLDLGLVRLHDLESRPCRR